MRKSRDESKWNNQAKLIADKECLQDPFGIAEGWLPEDASVKFWPMTLYPDIFKT